jgi:putative MATE family efflux protein
MPVERHRFSSLARIALPLMASNLVQTLYNLADAFFLGKLGEAELSAPTIAFPIIFFLILFGIGFSMAGTTLIAQAKGKGDDGRVDFYLGQSAVILTVTSLLIAVTGVVVTEPLLRLLQTPQEVYVFTRDYTMIIFAGLPFMFGFLILQSAMQGIGRTMIPLWVQLGTVALNIALDPLLIFGFGFFPAWGVRGAAAATVIARGLSSVVALALLVRGRHGLRLQPVNMRPTWEAVRLFFRIGLPSSFGQALTALGFTVLQGIVNSFGAPVIAAFGVGNRLIGLFNMPALGISRAVTTLVGQNLGARDPEGAKRIVYTGALSIQVFLIPAMTLTFFFGGSFIRFFVNDLETIAYGAELFRIVAPSVVFFGFFHAFIGAFQGAGDTKPVMVLNVARLWLLRVPIAWLLAVVLGVGPEGIWWSMFISNSTAAAATIYWFGRGRWINALDPDLI